MALVRYYPQNVSTNTWDSFISCAPSQVLPTNPSTLLTNDGSTAVFNVVGPTANGFCPAPGITDFGGATLRFSFPDICAGSTINFVRVILNGYARAANTPTNQLDFLQLTDLSGAIRFFNTPSPNSSIPWGVNVAPGGTNQTLLPDAGSPTSTQLAAGLNVHLSQWGGWFLDAGGNYTYVSSAADFVAIEVDHTPPTAGCNPVAPPPVNQTSCPAQIVALCHETQVFGACIDGQPGMVSIQFDAEGTAISRTAYALTNPPAVIASPSQIIPGPCDATTNTSPAPLAPGGVRVSNGAIHVVPPSVKSVTVQVIRGLADTGTTTGLSTITGPQFGSTGMSVAQGFISTWNASPGGTLNGMTVTAAANSTVLITWTV